MTLGIALLLIFSLYLIDKHNQWRRATRVALGLVTMAIPVVAGIYWWNKHEEKLEEQEIEKKAKEEYEKIKSGSEQQAPEAQVIQGPDKKWYSVKNGDMLTFEQHFIKQGWTKKDGKWFKPTSERSNYPRLMTKHDSDLSTEEFGTLTCGHVKHGDQAILLQDDGTWVKVRTATGQVGWSRSDAFEVISQGP